MVKVSKDFPLCSRESGTPDFPGIESFGVGGYLVGSKGSSGTCSSIGTSGSGGSMGTCTSKCPTCL